MRTRRLEKLFARYRSRGDLAALAEVFDGTAVDLLRLAQHLVREDAEDLLQETFVTAIERAASWDPARPLLPWLAGILAHKAARARRREGRVLDAAALEDRSARAPSDPLAAAAARELSADVARALASFDARERGLLEPYLRGERAPLELAREHGLAPGTVRMRIHRGLERLRRLLPVGVYGGALALTLSPRGLAAVRATVLARAARLAPVPTALTLSSGTSAALLVAMTKTTTLLCSIAAAATLAGALYWTQRSPVRDASAPEPAAGAVREVAAQGPIDTTPAVRGESAAPASAPLASAASERRADTRKSLRLEGRVGGVRASDHAGVRVRIHASSAATVDVFGLEWSPDADWASADAVACEYARRDVGCASCHMAPQQEQLRRERVDRQTLVETRVELGQLAFQRTLADISLAHREPLAEIGVDRDGRFAIELADHLAEAGTELPASFVVTAEHELYFGARAAVAFDPADRERFLTEEPVALESELELVPAAIVRGSIQARTIRLTFSIENGGELRLDGGEIAVLLADLTVAAQRDQELEVTGAEGVPILESIPSIGRFYAERRSSHSFLGPGATVALFRLEHGRPLATPAAWLSAHEGQPFELKIAEEGTFALVAFREGARPHTVPLELELLEIETLEPIDLGAGAEIAGTLYGASPESASDCRVIATREPLADDVALEVALPLVWSGGAFEWKVLGAGLDEAGAFRVEGAGEGFHGLAAVYDAALDLASLGDEPVQTRCLAPASDLVLAPGFAVLDVRITQSGAVLETLPEPVAAVDELASTDESGQELTPPPILVRALVPDEEASDELALEGRTRFLALAAPGVRMTFQLLVGEEVRDAVELLTPPAGGRQAVLLELGDL